MADKTERLAIIVSAQNQASKALKSVAKDLGSLDRAAVKSAGIAARGARTAIGNIGKIAMAGAGLAAAGGAAAIKWAGDFQAQLNTINTIAMTTPAGLKAIGDSILGISKKTGIGLTDLTGAYYDLLSAGVKAKDAQSLLNNAVTLGVGGLATTGEAVDLLTTAYNAYGLTAGGAAKATDMFAQAVADGKVKASEIAASFANVASIAKTYNIGINQIAASYGFLTAQGVPAAEVTTEMNRAIISLIKPSKDLKVAQKKLGVDFTKEIKSKGLVGALQELRKYSDDTGIPLINLLGRVEAVKYALQTTGPNAKGYAAELVRINNSAGEAAKQAAERQQGLNFELDRLRQEAIAAGITIGNELIPTVADLAHQANTFLEGHQGDIRSFGQDLGKAFKEAVVWAEKLDWKGIGHALQGAAGFAKTLIQAFADAPPWLQQAVVTGWGLNKLSGGALVDITGTMAKGALGSTLGSLGGLLQRGASPASPMYVKDVGGIGIPGAAGAAGAPVAAIAASFAAIVGAPFYLSWLAKTFNPTNDPNNPAGRTFNPAATNANGLLPPGIHTGSRTPNMPGQGQFVPGSGIAPPQTGGLSPDERQAALDASRKNLSNWADQVTGDFAHIDVAGKAFQTALAKNAAAVKKFDAAKAARDLIAGIRKRSADKYGGTGLGKAAVLATTNRDLEGQARSIVKSSKDQAWKLEHLSNLQREAKAAGASQAGSIIAHLIAVQTSVKNQKVTVDVNVHGVGVQATGTALDWKKYPHDGKTWAAGGSGMSRGPARLPGLGVFGEAGGEAFAILRRPQVINGAAVRQMILHATIVIPPLTIDPKGATHGLYRFQSTVLGRTG